MKAWVVSLAVLAVALPVGSVLAQIKPPQPSAPPPPGSFFDERYPDKAWLDQLDGEATLSGELEQSGSLKDCRVVREKPSGYGFGDYLAKRCGGLLLGLPPRPIGQTVTLTLHAVIPDWIRARAKAESGKPVRAGDTERYYPDRAMRMEKTGEVTLDCLVRDNGRLADCKTISETPIGYGFGDAAIKMSTAFRVPPDLSGHIAAGGRTTFDVAFRLQ